MLRQIFETQKKVLTLYWQVREAHKMGVLLMVLRLKFPLIFKLCSRDTRLVLMGAFAGVLLDQSATRLFI